MTYESKEWSKTDKLNYAGIFEALPKNKRSDARDRVDYLLDVFEGVNGPLLSLLYEGTVSKKYEDVMENYEDVMRRVEKLAKLIKSDTLPKDLRARLTLLELHYLPAMAEVDKPLKQQTN